MESYQNLHTHAVDSAIQLQGNSRVPKKRQPPISDEEQRLNRRQRCTLSQLRSGHCHLLQDYKHRVIGELTEICTDCGALGSKRHSLQVVELSQRTQAAVQIMSNLPAPRNGGPTYRFLGMSATRTRWMAGGAAHKDG